jgi:hypothetical protein
MAFAPDQRDAMVVQPSAAARGSARAVSLGMSLTFPISSEIRNGVTVLSRHHRSNALERFRGIAEFRYDTIAAMTHEGRARRPSTNCKVWFAKLVAAHSARPATCAGYADPWSPASSTLFGY